ncbi:MAG: nitroreductase family protein [Candidatus Thorarchaeota archaeon]
MKSSELLLDVIEERHSGRAYSSKPVPEDKLQSILEAGRRAPSCSNTQAWNFVVLTDEKALNQAHAGLSRGNSWAKDAPVMIMVAAKEDGGCPAHGLPYFMMDCGLAIENMLLQAVHLGLMGHPTAGWDETKLKEINGVPEEYRITAVVFFGYQEDLDKLDTETRKKEESRSNRRPLSEIVHRNGW